VAVDHPLIIVEVLSPSTSAIDRAFKLREYFRLLYFSECCGSRLRTSRRCRPSPRARGSSANSFSIRKLARNTFLRDFDRLNLFTRDDRRLPRTFQA
jgi:hypothetical protein